MRLMLDDLIRDANALRDHYALESMKIIERLEELRGEMHNRRPVSRGKITSNKVTNTVRQRVIILHRTYPTLPQHEIARKVGIKDGRVSEILAGKRE